MLITKLKIRTDGDPCLRQLSEGVKQIGPAEVMLVQSMLKTMYEAEGIGLAAPQVGINKKIFVADVGDSPFVFINPEILEQEGNLDFEEGCLSFPGKTVKIFRSKRVKVKFQNMYGKSYARWFEGLMARAIQHENDHLYGKLIVDYIDSSKKV